MNRICNFGLILLALLFVLPTHLSAQKKSSKKKKTEVVVDSSTINSSIFSAFKFRNIGPAFMSGRIADIAIHPEDENTWYIGVGSGGVWKTKNAGTTWKPIFDGQSVYSIGCITIDHNNPHKVWVGTGENVGGRHVSFGDGIYLSEDDGVSWTNMGLKKSEHISKIIIHPTNSDILWVAAQGPLWSKGGERGIFKTTDGGQNWKRVLGDDEWVGATDMLIDPRNPNVLYAATWQRHRTVAAYLGGGPGTAIYKSTDGGENWNKLSKGLPTQNMGKIGLAISPQNPDVVYAAITLERRKGGVYRSDNAGASWKKMSGTVSGATGPHYYQELYASPHEFDRIYLADIRMQVSNDGGKTFKRMKETYKHSDNHALAFKKDDPDYLLVGTDGGLYESHDLAQNWKFINNLPVTQYYKLALDDALPFYNIVGGTQDNNTQVGPSRTDNLHGIQNSDWEVLLFGDGHQTATEPGNPNIVYAQWQQGNLVRVDRKTGEMVYVQPQPGAGESYERFNWDAPILVSPHNSTTLYHASHRLWKSNDRGDSWTAISGDLTRNENRFELPIMGKKWSWDNPWDVFAMSTYSTITSISESPVKAGLLYIGTDDGLVQISENDGGDWRKIEVGSLPGIPSTAFVDDIKADIFDENTVYICLDNHKYGDYKPYVLKSADKGNSWTMITIGLPDNHLTWRIVQDHIKPELMFLGTEFGLFVTLNGGKEWIKMKAGLPTISFRDLAIQKRENDLVAASFGRGVFVLDDYSPLRNINEEQLAEEAFLFKPRDARSYIQRGTLGFDQKGSQGAAHYTAPNPPYGTEITYYIKDGYQSMKAERQETEKTLREEGKEIPFPGWEQLNKENKEKAPVIWLEIRNESGALVRRLKGENSSGFHRISWNLKANSLSPVKLPKSEKEMKQLPQSVSVAPGTYKVQLVREEDGQLVQLSDPKVFEVKKMNQGTLPEADPKAVAAFWERVSRTRGDALMAMRSRAYLGKRISAMRQALLQAPRPDESALKELHALQKDIEAIQTKMGGNSAKNEVGEKNAPTVWQRIDVATTGTNRSFYGPTPTHIEQMNIAEKEIADILQQLKRIESAIPALEKAIQATGAPWVEGQALPE